MKIFGIGTDIVNIKRIENLFKTKGDSFKNRIFSKNEIKYCESKKKSFHSYAKRFAAKEAVSKAIGTGIRKNVIFKNIEIYNDSTGKPFVKLDASTSKFLKKKLKCNNYSIFLSLSDDKPWAQATVIISYK